MWNVSRVVACDQQEAVCFVVESERWGEPKNDKVYEGVEGLGE